MNPDNTDFDPERNGYVKRKMLYIVAGMYIVGVLLIGWMMYDTGFDRGERSAHYEQLYKTTAVYQAKCGTPLREHGERFSATLKAMEDKGEQPTFLLYTYNCGGK